jgi:hypothetical protein
MASYMYWLFEKLDVDQMAFQMINLQSAGIYKFWKYWIEDRTFILASLIQHHDPVPQDSVKTSPFSFGSKYSS